MMTVNIDRKKVLQMTLLKTVRAMRSVFGKTLRQEIILRTALDLLTSTMSFHSRLERR